MQLRSHFLVAAIAFQILRPVDQSVLETGVVKVVAKGDATKLVVDGKQAATTDLKLAQGMHELALGDQKIRVFVKGAEPPPDGWTVFRTHPPAAACSACHVAKEGGGEVKSYETSCAGCHQLANFAKTHTHAPTVLEECQLCHQPHGSTVRFHLKLTKEIACKQCHG
jgi:predicted CXXCH cytochrome family protein